MFLVLWCDADHEDEMVHTSMSCFAVDCPKNVDAQGLFDCLKHSLGRRRIHTIDGEQCEMLIGIGTDGASANVAAGGLKGLACKFASLLSCLALPFYFITQFILVCTIFC